MLLDFCDANLIQEELALDGLNRCYGRSTVTLGSSGIVIA
jgi:hypothetical protein